MIEIKREDRCCGCGACAVVCPKHCITMVENAEGFRYPKVNTEQCVNCGLCEQTCPYLNLSVKGDILKQPDAYYIRSKDEAVLAVSASGGMFYEFARLVLTMGGVAYGCVWGDRYDESYHRRIDKLEELHLLQGSKYVQSDMKNCFQEAKSDLDAGTLVIFSGTPCQIAALLTFLKKDYDNLLTCDIVCHGVPSPVVLRNFLNEKEKKTGKKVKEYRRDKTIGWKPVHFRVLYEDGSYEVIPPEKNSYNRLFSAKNSQHRNSCYCCRFERLPRIADISLGDYFGEKDALDLNGNTVTPTDNKGMSLITVNTAQGERFFRMVVDRTEYTQLKLYSIRAWHLFQGPGGAGNPGNRKKLFFLLKNGLTVDEAYEILFGNASKGKKLYYKLNYHLSNYIKR